MRCVRCGDRPVAFDSPDRFCAWCWRAWFKGQFEWKRGLGSAPRTVAERLTQRRRLRRAGLYRGARERHRELDAAWRARPSVAVLIEKERERRQHDPED